MINWPTRGNDFYLDVIEEQSEQRFRQLQKAKDHTLSFIYFLRHQLGFKQLGLAKDEFPTADKMPFIPYIKESRRVRGLVTLTLNDIIDVYRANTENLYQQGIAVGNYPLDHHHAKSPKTIQEKLPQISAFNVPYGCLVPQGITGLLVAEKSISVTHLVNGCTRLQPVVMQVGQAAGAASALCVKKQIQPGDLDIRQLQEVLIEANCWLMPFTDINAADWFFAPAQKAALCGLLKGVTVHQDWANEFYFYPDNYITGREFFDAVNKIIDVNEADLSEDIGLNRDFILFEKIQQIFGGLLSASQLKRSVIKLKNPSILSDFESMIRFIEEDSGLPRNTLENEIGSKHRIRRKIFVYLLAKIFEFFKYR